MKKCADCKFTKPLSEWPGKGNGPRCLQCKRERAAEDRAQTRDYLFEILGRECACCGEKERIFLDIDHVFNDGWKNRRPVAYTQVLKDPERYQILCRNCNWAKYLGVCPHRRV